MACADFHLSTARAQSVTSSGTGGDTATGLQLSLMSQAPLEQARKQTEVLPQPETILVDPFGLTSRLRAHGISLVLDNVNEMSSMINSPTPELGLSKEASNTGQYSMENVIDWGRLAGFTGLSTHAVVVGRYGIPVSPMFGDMLLTPSQEIYGQAGMSLFTLSMPMLTKRCSRIAWI